LENELAFLQVFSRLNNIATSARITTIDRKYIWSKTYLR